MISQSPELIKVCWAVSPSRRFASLLEIIQIEEQRRFDRHPFGLHTFNTSGRPGRTFWARA